MRSRWSVADRCREKSTNAPVFGGLIKASVIAATTLVCSATFAHTNPYVLLPGYIHQQIDAIRLNDGTLTSQQTVFGAGLQANGLVTTTALYLQRKATVSVEIGNSVFGDQLGLSQVTYYYIVYGPQS